ncbi:hypothetical protein FGRMN_7545 [Fusarium graminum]|nr:hypothetical protein FGRMN_7545 [Fusarium graminum]
MSAVENTAHQSQNYWKRSATPDFDFKSPFAPVLGAEKPQSFTAWVKDTVRARSGPSSFTEDGNWSEPQEAPYMTSQPLQTYDLPCKNTATALVKFYFANVKNPDKCLLCLTLAIGLAIGDPKDSGAHSRDLQDRLFAEAEALFCPYDTSGTLASHYDPLWFLQVLALMSYYMLATSRRNMAYEYCGRAVSRAYTLGIYRGHETEADNFPTHGDQTVLRRNIWRSLFILDRFLAASLGRSMAISDSDYYESSLGGLDMSSTRDILDAAVDACRIIGLTLNSNIPGRNASFEVPNQMTNYLEYHPDFNNDTLFENGTENPYTMAQLNVQLLGCYANILVCRPFFLLRFRDGVECKTLDGIEVQINKLSQKCVSQSLEAIRMANCLRSTTPYRFDPLAL